MGIISGELIKVLEVQKGQGEKGEWQRGGLVIKTEGKYPKEIAFQCFNGKGLVDTVSSLQVGLITSVDYNLESREYNGKYFTNATLWKVSQIGVVSESTQPTQSNANQEHSEDLPF